MAARHFSIPRVSRRFRQVHLDHPHQVRHMDLRGGDLKSLQMFRAFAPTVRFLVVAPDCDFEDPSIVSQLLADAAIGAPKLHRLLMELAHGRAEPLLQSLLLFKNLITLDIEHWRVSPDDSLPEDNYFTGLQSLKEMHISLLNVSDAPEDWAEALWGNLATIKTLRRVVIAVKDEMGDEDPEPAFFHSISQLSQIRELDVWVNIQDRWGENDHTFHRELADQFVQDASWEELPNLTQLKFGLTSYASPQSAYQSIGEFHHLKVLEIKYYSAQGMVPCLSLVAPELTRLVLEKLEQDPKPGPTLRLDNHLDPEVSSLPKLKVLQLNCLTLEDIPDSLATGLTAVTSLGLVANRFVRLPAALSYMTSLEEVNMFGNIAMELTPGDVDVLAALPNLKGFNLSKTFRGQVLGRWSQTSIEVLAAIRARLPGLELWS